MEIATKVRIGKLPGASAIAENIAGSLAGQDFASPPISFAPGQAAGTLPSPHKNPFDPMLIAQTMLELMILVSNQQQFDVYGVQRLW